jgi:hypothetical protein
VASRSAKCVGLTEDENLSIDFWMVDGGWMGPFDSAFETTGDAGKGGVASS